jgi:hypothetical protein
VGPTLAPKRVQLSSPEPATTSSIIALHLEQDSSSFGCWTIGDLDQDNLTLRPASTHRHWTPKTRFNSVWKEEQLHYAMTRLEIPCEHPVKLPVPYVTGTILHAHLARRRAAGARNGDPLLETTGGSPTQTIRRAVRHVDMQPW